MKRFRLAVIGGGAAGFFSAITAAEICKAIDIVIFEKGSQVLSKVRISGGGRCNVTHSCFNPSELIANYPRGGRELRGPFHHWQPSHTIDWFQSRGVPLKTESDGRIFPKSDKSDSIIDCLMGATKRLGVEIKTRTVVQSIRHQDNLFFLRYSNNSEGTFDAVVIATGGGASSGGLKFAKSLGHTITPLAPSLFTFHIKNPIIKDLQGLSVENVRCSSPQLKSFTIGPVLITHWGLSGPGILKLSSIGARAFRDLDYKFSLDLNWTGTKTKDQVLSDLIQIKEKHGKKQVDSIKIYEIPKRIYLRVLAACSIPAQKQWAQLSKHMLSDLTEQLVHCRFQVIGKSMNKEEFVTCGGVDLKEIDFKSMESKILSGLYFAGEVLDIDGVTGGFNFQSAWTTGRIAGESIARKINRKDL